MSAVGGMHALASHVAAPVIADVDAVSAGTLPAVDIHGAEQWLVVYMPRLLWVYMLRYQSRLAMLVYMLRRQARCLVLLCRGSTLLVYIRLPLLVPLALVLLRPGPSPSSCLPILPSRRWPRSNSQILHISIFVIA